MTSLCLKCERERGKKKGGLPEFWRLGVCVYEMGKRGLGAYPIQQQTEAKEKESYTEGPNRKVPRP